MLVADPVAEGIVPEIGARSEDNITGTSHVVPTDAKLKVVAKSLPKSASGAPYRIGLLYSTYPSAVSEKKALLESIKGQQDIEVLALEFPFVPGEAGKASMLEAAQKLIRENEDKFDGLWLATGPNGANARYVQGVKVREAHCLCRQHDLGAIGCDADGRVNTRDYWLGRRRRRRCGAERDKTKRHSGNPLTSFRCRRQSGNGQADRDRHSIGGADVGRQQRV